MQSNNRFFEDLAKVLNGMAGTMAGVGREAEAGARERFREFVGGADFVSREEFNAVKAMAAMARADNDILAARIARLEARLGLGDPVPANKASVKTASVKATGAKKPTTMGSAAKVVGKPARKQASTKAKANAPKSSPNRRAK